MHLAVDVDYRAEGDAVAAGVLFDDWDAATPAATILQRIETVAPYQPGRFYARELPAIGAVVDVCPEPPRTIVIDGYVTLGADRRDGLGAYLFHALDRAIPVIGVAKSRFRGTPVETAVTRGGSARPLYVTAIGIDEVSAREQVRTMHGAHRIPTLLAAVDRACRTG